MGTRQITIEIDIHGCADDVDDAQHPELDPTQYHHLFHDDSYYCYI